MESRMTMTVARNAAPTRLPTLPSAHRFSELKDAELYTPAALAEYFETQRAGRLDEEAHLSFLLFLLELTANGGFPANGDAPGAVLDQGRPPAWFGARWKRAHADWLRQESSAA